MCSGPEICSVAALLADPARAAILVALLDARPHAAADLAQLAGITAQTASSHLSKLAAGGLIHVVRDGRYRLYTLAGVEVHDALKSLSALAQLRAPGESELTDERKAIRLARVCYSHVGGRLGVLMTDKMQSRGFLVPAGVKQYAVTNRGAEWLSALGVDVASLEAGHHGIARQCLDWSERQPHLGGPLGASFMEAACEREWFVRHTGTRALELTAIGVKALRSELALSKRDLSGDLQEFSNNCVG